MISDNSGHLNWLLQMNTRKDVSSIFTAINEISVLKRMFFHLQDCLKIYKSLNITLFKSVLSLLQLPSSVLQRIIIQASFTCMYSYTYCNKKTLKFGPIYKWQMPMRTHTDQSMGTGCYGTCACSIYCIYLHMSSIHTSFRHVPLTELQPCSNVAV